MVEVRNVVFMVIESISFISVNLLCFNIGVFYDVLIY